jgi:transposase-like protein
METMDQRSDLVRRSPPVFKAEVVELIRQSGQIASVARDLDLTETACANECVRPTAMSATVRAG